MSDIEKVMETIEIIERFRPRYITALLNFLQGARVPIILPPSKSKYGLHSPSRPHTRATLRCIQACETLAIKPLPPALHKESIREVVQEAWQDPKKTNFGTHNFYTTSNILYLARMSDSPFLAEIKSRVTRQLNDELAKKEPNPFLILYAHEALGQNRQSKRTSQLALRILYDQIVYYSARLIRNFDSAKLAAAAVLVSRAAPQDVSLSAEEQAHIVRHAAEVILGTEDLPTPFRLPKPQHAEAKTIIYTVPWEEILLMSKVPLHCMPLDMPVIERLVMDLQSSFVELTSHKSGWTLSFDPDFPEPLSWLTALYSDILERCLHLLRFGYTEKYLRKIEKEDPIRVYRFSDGVIDSKVRSWNDVLETEGKAKSIITDRVFGGTSRTSEPLKKSLLLFGPPGTSKTTMVKGLAYHLMRKRMKMYAGESWPLLIVNPADIIGDGGYEQLISRMRIMIRQIRELSEVVVLFDEAENLVFQREGAGESRLDRMVTAAMLPLLDGIESREIVFAMATNHIGKIDAAVRRKGRFALRIAVGPPALSSRNKLIRELCPLLASQPTLRNYLARKTDYMTIKEVTEVCDKLMALSIDSLSQSPIDRIVKSFRQKPEINQEVKQVFKEDMHNYHDMY